MAKQRTMAKKPKTTAADPAKEKSKVIPASYEARLYRSARAVLGTGRDELMARVREKIAQELGGVLSAKRVVGLQRQAQADQEFIVEFRAITRRRFEQVSAELRQIPADDWNISHEPTYQAIEQAELALCESTRADLENATMQQAGEVIDEIRQQIATGMRQGESIGKLTGRVAQFFDLNLRWKARRIARTESTRAYNLGTYMAGQQSPLVEGWEWLLSIDACDKCKAIGMENGKPRRVGKNQPFATNQSDNPAYSTINFPPLHPHCRCVALYVLADD